jgi:integrase
MARKRGQGEGSIYQRGDGMWVAAISLGRDPATGKPRRRVAYGQTRKEAAEKLQQLQQEQVAGQSPTRRDITVEALCQEYLNQKDNSWSEATKRNAEQHLRIHVVSAIGALRLSELDPATVARWYRSMKAGRSAELAREYFSGACEMAVRWEWLTRNPVALLEPRRRETSRPEEISLPQMRAILESAQGTRYGATIAILLGCGLRISECLGLCWSDWDETQGLLRVERQLSFVGAGPPVFAPLKSRASRRTLQVPHFVTEALVAHREAGRFIEPGYEPEPQWKNLITLSARAKPCLSGLLRATLSEARDAAGMKRLTPHHLRHAFASVLIDQGVPITEVAEALGHASPAITMQVYAHKLAGRPQRTGGIMDNAIFAQTGSVATEVATKSTATASGKQTALRKNA